MPKTTSPPGPRIRGRVAVIRRLLEQLPDPCSMQDLADAVRRTTQTVRNWVACGILPAPVRLGARPMWAHETLLRHFAEQEQEAATDAR